MRPDEICREFLSLPGVAAVIQFGSTARGSSSEAGDLDALVIVRNPGCRRSVVDFADVLSRRFGVDVSVTAFTMTEFSDRLAETPSFGAHLRDEGRLYGTGCERKAVQSILDAIVVTPESLEIELAELRTRLERVSDVSKHAGHYATALGRLYGIGRAASILRLMALGEARYDWRVAFEHLSKKSPELRHEIEVVSSLRPYFEALDGRCDPEQAVDHADYAQFETSVQAVTLLTLGSVG